MDLADRDFWLLALIVGSAFSVEATTGFGATVIAVTLGVHLFPLETLLPVIVPVGLTLTATIAWRQRAHVDRALLLRGILPFMAAGAVFGLAIFERASNDSLRRVFGVFVVLVAASELLRLLRAVGPARPLPPLVARAAIFAAGVIHGLFSSGGPLLVYAIGRTPIEKRVFRATLSNVWLVLGSMLTATYAWNGHVTRDSLLASAALLPVLGVSFVVGDWAHHRLDEFRFRLLVNVLLLGAGLTNVF
jgi:uncharacterized membrane protein YfcA